MSMRERSFAADTAAKREHDAARGRQAQRPSEIPHRGWWDILVRVRNELAKDHLSIVAAGVALYGFLAIFPGLAALVSIYGLLTDAADLQRHMSSIEGLLPAEAANIINTELQRIVESQPSKLGWALIGGTIIALWSASKGMKAMFESMNIVYDEEEKRGFFELNGLAVLLTLGTILFVIFFLGIIIGVPAVLASFPIGEFAGQVVNYARWPLLAVCVIVALAVLYRYGPSREKVQWKWVSWGAVVATVIWLAGSSLFSFYVSNFGSYDKTYGSLGVIVILITWFLLGAYSILLGAEINAEMEHQTAKDTTTEEPQPIGRRGAYVADTVGETADESGRKNKNKTRARR
jgi:membrane protein